MSHMLRHHLFFTVLFVITSLVAAAGELPFPEYHWTEATAGAAFPGGYNFPLFSVRNQLLALHNEANWYSKDGSHWTKAELPHLDFNSAYQQYVLFNGSIYALGSIRGNYLDMTLGSRIARTSRDFTRWETVAEK